VVAPPAPTVEATAPRTPVRRGRRRRLTARDISILSVLVGITVILDVILIWGTSVASIFLSFTNYDGISTIKWVGGKNYHDLVTIYPAFWTAVRNNLLWLGFLGLIATPLGLFLAVLLDKRIRLTRFYQGALYLPVALSLAVVGFIAQLILASDHGALNVLLGRPTSGIDFIGDPKINIWMVLLFAGWRHTGYIMILYLAGLKSVDPALKEAATIDGANEGQTFFRVVFPTMRPINIIVLVITVIESLRAFDVVFAINQGRNGLQLLSVLVVENIIGEASRIGYGSAIAVILMLVTLGFIITYLTQMLREDNR
jgi:multiple sugar transport system permease protein